MPSRSMSALFTAIGGQRWDNDQTRLAKAILSTNAVLFQSQPCDECCRCFHEIYLNIHHSCRKTRYGVARF
jgi:hypothetical protein